MIILILFAFLGGIVTILSPCILPILPIVLSSSITGGKKRPLGVVTGFILSFTFFTLFLSALVKISGVSPDTLRALSVFIIAAFGLSLLVPGFQVMMEKLFSRLAGAASASSQKASQVKSDFVGGVFIGLSLGLIWTPCVGPILASVITLAATSTVNFQAFILTLAYSIGTAIPLLAITYGGRELLNKHPALIKNSGKIQKVFGVLMILTALAIFLNFDRKFQSYILDTFPQYGTGLTKLEDNDLVKKALDAFHNEPVDEDMKGKPMFETQKSDFGLAQEFILGGQWFNSNPLTIKELKGKVVLVDFWTYTCINCIRTLPYLRSWHEKYADQGLVIVGVHTPEFEFEKSPDNVQQAIKDFDIKYPVMQDNEFATWNRYKNRYWPAKYLIDKNGRIRYTHFGEGKYDETEKMIQVLLEETGTEVNTQINNPTYQIQGRTPELYLGNARRIPNFITFTGKWNYTDEAALPTSGSTLELNFEAKEVFLVMKPKENSTSKIKIIIDNFQYLPDDFLGDDVQNILLKPDMTPDQRDDRVIESNIEVSENRLYKIIDTKTPGKHKLKLEFTDDSVELYAFTFG